MRAAPVTHCSTTLEPVSGGDDGPAAAARLRAWVLACMLAGTVPATAFAQCPARGASVGNEGGVQFPGPAARVDLRESLSVQRDCMPAIKPRRLSKSELQDIRRAVRSQSRFNHVGSREPERP